MLQLLVGLTIGIGIGAALTHMYYKSKNKKNLQEQKTAPPQKKPLPIQAKKRRVKKFLK